MYTTRGQENKLYAHIVPTTRVYSHSYTAIACCLNVMRCFLGRTGNRFRSEPININGYLKVLLYTLRAPKLTPSSPIAPKTPVTVLRKPFLRDVYPPPPPPPIKISTISLLFDGSRYLIYEYMYIHIPCSAPNIPL